MFGNQIHIIGVYKIITLQFTDMKHFTFIALLSMLGLVLFTNCKRENSVDVNQDRIYTDYELFYNSNTDVTWVVARFRFGNATGTHLELSNDAFVLFNNDTLPYNFFYTGHFKEYAGRLTSGTFTYHDNDGNVFVNDVLAYDTIQFTPGFDTIIKGQSNEITWVGKALQPNERVGVFVGSWTWGEDALAIQGNDGAQSVILNANQTNNIATGPSTVYMDRIIEVDPVEAPSAGGRLRSKFRAFNASVQVVE